MWLLFQLFANEDADANLFGMTHVTPDYYPQIIVEGEPSRTRQHKAMYGKSVC